MRISKLCYLGLCSIVLAIGLLSCTEEPAIVAVTSVKLDSTSITLIEGDSQALNATVFPSNAENQKVLWSSSNSSVASVKEGVVTALKVGNATIIAKTDDGGKTASCTVIVEAKNIPVTGVLLDKTSYEMTEGEEFTLTATINPENATNKNVSWSSSNSSVATVDNGKVTALAPGQTTITAITEDGGKTATCEITVNPTVYPVESISLDKTSYEMTEGEEFTLTATINPENATNKNVSWSSSNSSVATVDNGKVTALAPGQTTITAITEDGGKTATCEVIVNKRIYHVENITLNIEEASLMIGDELTLIATISPTNATDKTVIWSSSDPSVVSVDNGQLTAHKLGTAVITATTQDGGKTASCVISVVNIDSLVRAKFTNMSTGSGGSMSFEGGYVKLTAGVKMGVSISNYSTRDITVTGFKMICGLQNVPIEYSINETTVPGGKSLKLTATIVATMYSPIAEFTYTYEGDTYTARVQYNGSF